MEEEQKSKFRKITLGRAQASTLRSPPLSKGQDASGPDLAIPRKGLETKPRHSAASVSSPTPSRMYSSEKAGLSPCGPLAPLDSPQRADSPYPDTDYPEVSNGLVLWVSLPWLLQ